MAIRAKTKRRLFILLGSVAAVIALGATVYTVRMAQIRADILESRDEGRVALEEGDYFQAMHKLGRYLQHHASDPEVTYQYAQARLEVEEADGRHLTHGANALRRALALDPENSAIRRRLLKVYSQIGFFNETIDTAEALLRENPDDAEAMRAQVEALLRLRMYERAEEVARVALEQDADGQYVRSPAIVREGLRAQATVLEQQGRHAAALPLAEQYIALAPDDFEMQQLTLTLMDQAGHTVEQQYEHVEALRASDPSHPGFAVLEARVARRAEDAARARQALEQAAAGDLDKASVPLASAMLDELDRQRMFARSLEVLEQFASVHDTLPFRQVLAQRLALAGQWETLAQRFASLMEMPDAADSLLLAMLAMAQFEQDERAAGERVVDVLRGRINDATAVDWSSVLPLVYGETPAEPQRMVEVVRRANPPGMSGAFFQHWLGQAYRQLGEWEMAVGAWGQAAQLAPSWPEPAIEAAQVSLENGQPREATALAQLALQRAPNDLRAAIILAEAVTARWDALRPEQARELLRLVEQIQTAAPFEPRSLVLQVRLLMRDGETAAARERVTAALEAEARLPAAAVMQLADAMANAGDDAMRQRLLARLDADDAAVSATAALNQAQALLDAGQPDKALSMIEERLAEADAGQRRGWRLARARVLDRMNDARALAAWTELLNEYPDDVRAHQHAMASSAVWRDRALAAATIERLRALTGEAALSWRVARARWLLEGPEDQRRSSEVVELLQHVLDASSQNTQAHLLLAQHYEQSGNLSSAINQMTRVVRAYPERPAYRLRLARLLQARGDDEQARMHMEQVARRSDAMSADQRRQVAGMYVQRGNVAEAIALLEPHHGESVEQDLLLAQLYAATGRTAEAEQMYAAVLERPTREAVVRAATFYAQQDRASDAARALSMLDEMALEPGERELAQGDFHASQGETAEAIAYYQQAVEAAPARAALWRRWLAYAMAAGEVDEAVSGLAEAARALPDDAPLGELAAHGEAIRAAGQFPPARPLLVMMLADPSQQGTALTAVQRLAEADAPASALPALASLAERHPRLLALQALVYQLLASQERYDEAVALAERAVRAMPGASEPLWMLAEALSAAGRWSEAMAVAQRWRERGGGRSAMADQLIAEAQLNLGDASSALRQMEPYLEDALASPDENAPSILRAARAMIAGGDAEQAAVMLGPLLERSARWRSAWMQLAVSALEDDVEAARWLERLDEAIPADERGERMQLAQGWWSLYERTQSASHRDGVRRTLAPMAEAEPPFAPAVMALAVLEDAAGNKASAEAGYRQALALEPDLSIAANNLAVILHSSGRELDEAVRLARRAVALTPEHAPFHHTLAQSLQAQGDDAAALASMRQAVELDASNPRWAVALAQMLLQQRDVEAAGDVLAEIDEQFPLLENVPEEVRDDLDAVRAELADQQRRSQR
ncbi:MAG: tetratricopeptide repeat protein [Phycisphaeraceae bacterium]